MKRPWMPLWIDDYMAATATLTTQEHGAYLLLIFHYWREGSLPEDDKKLARIVRLSLKEWMAIREVIAGFFFDGWKHKRVEKELAKCSDLSEKRKVAAERSHAARSQLRVVK